MNFSIQYELTLILCGTCGSVFGVTDYDEDKPDSTNWCCPYCANNERHKRVEQVVEWDV